MLYCVMGVYSCKGILLVYSVITVDQCVVLCYGCVEL